MLITGRCFMGGRCVCIPSLQGKRRRETQGTWRGYYEFKDVLKPIYGDGPGCSARESGGTLPACPQLQLAEYRSGDHKAGSRFQAIGEFSQGDCGDKQPKEKIREMEEEAVRQGRFRRQAQGLVSRIEKLQIEF